MHYVLVFLGGGIGAALRHGVNRASLAWLGPGFPWGTLAVNVLGSFAMGLLAGLFLARSGIGEEARLFLATGILGGFTTFSAFSLDASLLWQRGDYGPLALYVGGSVLLSIAALFAGLAMVRWLAW
jgi:fluoride exporter